MIALGAMAQNKPSFKVDICEYSRNNTDEVLEPGFVWWRFRKDVTADSLRVGDVLCTVSLPEGAEGLLRAGWNKAFVQNPTYKAQNGRLTGDGVNIDPTSLCGTIILRLEGLPKGEHTLLTYHNAWNNPEKCYGYPMTIKCNGEVVHENVKRTYQEPVAANACLVTTAFTVAYDGAAVEFEFITSEDNPPSAEEAEGKTTAEKTPIFNGFELNTADVSAQAKAPYPNSGDIHVDADATKSIMLSWSPANANVVQHRLYLATDSLAMAQMTSPVASLEYADTTYLVEDLYSMDTYWWRVDEVDASGNVTEGQAWYFRPRQLAFPGAEGYGRFATGGRGGIVYHVTNLNHDHNPGSLLYGLCDIEGPRTIVFDVSGIIEMNFSSFFAKPFVTIAAQTAPGKGICLKYSNMGITNESICRHLRARRGYGDTGNAMGCGGNHTIIDHTTAAWGTDETFSSRGAKNLTFQYSMIAEALGIADHKNYPAGTNHGFAATIGGEIGTFSHNFLVNCAGRNWSMGGGMDGNGNAAGSLDMFNNVCYNWNYRTTDGGAWRMQFVNNYYKMGPDTRVMQLFSADNEGGGERTQFAYVNGNIRDNRDGSLTHDQLNVTYRATGPEPEKAFVDAPFFDSQATIHTAQHAYKIVLSDAGATMPVRDDQHQRVVGEALNRTYTYVGSRSDIKGEIDHENDAGGFEAFPEETRPADFDTDQDGMPNWWEQLVGSDPDAADNNDDPDRDGWTLLEDYLDFMAHPYVVVAPGEQQSLDVAPFFRGFTNAPSYTIAYDFNGCFDAAIAESNLTVMAKQKGGVGYLVMQVTDADGDSFEQRLGIAVTGDPSAMPQVFDERQLNIVNREFFTIDGKPAQKMQHGETYVMRLTDAQGKIYTIKVIKN